MIGRGVVGKVLDRFQVHRCLAALHQPVGRAGRLRAVVTETDTGLTLAPAVGRPCWPGPPRTSARSPPGMKEPAFRPAGRW